MVGVGVMVGVNVIVGVLVAVKVGVIVGVWVAVAVAVGVGVGVASNAPTWSQAEMLNVNNNTIGTAFLIITTITASAF